MREPSTTVKEAKEFLLSALDMVPELTSFGLDYRLCSSKEKRRELFAKRKKLRAFPEREILQVRWCADWISHLDVNKHFNRSQSSYGLKHCVEHWVRTRFDQHQYISNGMFIAAAAGLGHERLECGELNPNAYFKFSKTSIRALMRNTGYGV